MSASPIAEPSPFLILGHRGSPREARENTLDSIRRALAAGADGYEIDLRLSADSRIVLYHDDEVDHDPVEGMTHQRLRERAMIEVPSLPEITPELRATRRLVLEVKMRGFEEQILEAIEGWDSVILSSFDHRVVERFHQLGCRAELGLVISAYILRPAEYAAGFGVRWYFPFRRFVDEALVTSLRENGVGVIPWTPNRHEEWARLQALGCAGIITDVPGHAAEWRRSLQEKRLC